MTASHTIALGRYIPPAKMVFTVEQLECDTPPNFQYDVTLDYMAIHDPNLTIEQSDFKLTLCTNRPRLSQAMTISW
jgi:hypothetical protein